MLQFSKATEGYQYENEMPKPQKSENENYDIKPHCQYCLMTDPKYLVKCKATGKYFCNGSLKGNKSHLLIHMTKSKVTEIALIPPNKFSQVPLQCISCSTSNIFTIGLYFSKVLKQHLVLCPNCLGTEKVRSFDIDTGNSCLFFNKQKAEFEEWFVPSLDLKNHSITISHSDISVLEESWKVNQRYTVNDIPALRKMSQLPKIAKVYYNVDSYQNVMRKLVSAEMEYDKKKTESFMIKDAHIDWKKDGERRHRAVFLFPTNELPKPIHIGDFMIIKDNVSFEESGVVFKINPFGKIEVLFMLENGAPQATHYTVRVKWNSVPYDRMLFAIDSFSQDKAISSDIRSIIIGKEVDLIPDKKREDVMPNRIQGVVSLNFSQLNAVKYSLANKFTFIHGPPGTGKTTTITAITHYLSSRNDGKVLICAPSNAATERVTMALAKTNIFFCRVVSKSREEIETESDRYSTHVLCQEIKNTKESNEYRRFEQLKLERPLTREEQSKHSELFEALQKQVIRSSNVVVCTCTTAKDGRLEGVRFPYVIIDEATQCIEPELLIPITKSCEKIILVGDHAQLGPVVTNPQCVKSGLCVSLIERLISGGFKPQMLEMQYRMHPALSEFSSNIFYGGLLKSGVDHYDRSHPKPVFPWITDTCPIMFFDYSSLNEEEVADSGTTYVNKYEATVVLQIVQRLLKSNVNPNNIGIITPYTGQSSYLTNFLSSSIDNFGTNIMISSVDSFQGGERDYIIFSSVRSNRDNTIGFLGDPKRLNVTVTRARYGLIMVGNASLLSSSSILWHKFITFLQKKNVVVEGQIESMKISQKVYSAPKSKKPTNETQNDHNSEFVDPSAIQNLINESDDEFFEEIM